MNKLTKVITDFLAPLEKFLGKKRGIALLFLVIFCLLLLILYSYFRGSSR